jgi:hypothetical protein
MYPHSLLWHYLWIAPHIFTAAIVWLMIRHRLAREFPFFLGYCVCQVIEQPILFALDHDARVSALLYWTIYSCLLVPQMALRFGVIYELFSKMFDPYPGLQELGRRLLKWTAVILILLAALFSGLSPGEQGNHLLSGISALNRAVGLIQSGLLIILFLSASSLRLSWRSHTFGIAVGLGLYSSVDLVIQATRIWLGIGAGTYALDFVAMAAYHCSVIIWIAYLLAPEPVGVSPAELPESNMSQWNAELQRLLLQ